MTQMGFILSLQTVEKAESSAEGILMVSAVSIGLCRSAVSAAC